MFDGKWFDYVAQSMIHALVAALAVEALLRLWRARAPGDRLAARLLGLGQPLLFTPAIFFLAPQRGAEEFHDRWAVFTARHWEEVAFGGISVLHVGVLLLVLLGVFLFLMDLVPLVRGRARALPPRAEAPAGLDAVVAIAAVAHGAAVPALHFVDLRAPILFCTGARHPTLVVSRGALALLDEEELRAALSHELAHLGRHDPSFSWILMGARAILFFNPVAQVVARALARDMEWRADEAAEDRLALASAVLKLYRAGLSRPGPRSPLAAAIGEPLRRVRSHDVESRCRRLLEPAAPRRLSIRPFRLALTSVCLAALTAFVA